jgi:hypothetical protein
MTEHVDSASDDRTANNAVRHKYRVLSESEKLQMQAIKDKGAEFLNMIDSLRGPAPAMTIADASAGIFERELNIAAERIEEAVMWAVKHITA